MTNALESSNIKGELLYKADIEQGANPMKLLKTVILMKLTANKLV